MFSPLSVMTLKAKVIGCLLILGAAFFCGWYISGNIWEVRLLTKEAEIAEAKAEAYREAIDKFSGLKETIELIDKQRYSEYVEYKKSFEILHSDLLSSTKRLSVLVQKRSSGISSDSPSQAPGMGDGAEQADLDPRVAAGLVGLTARGDKAIIQLNACQDILQAITDGDEKALNSTLERLSTPPQ